MIDDLLRNNLIIREWVNGGLLPLNISLVVVITLFLWRSWVKAWEANCKLATTYTEFHKMDGVTTACALIWIFAADAMRAGAAWYILWVANNKVPASTSSVDSMLVSISFMVAGIVGLLASIRCIYIFTPERLGHRYWIISVVATLAFQMLT